MEKIEIPLEKLYVYPMDYLTIFSTKAGRRVLLNFMLKGHFFTEIETEEERVEHNMTLRIMRNTGIIQNSTIRPIVKAMIDIAKRHPITSATLSPDDQSLSQFKKEEGE